MARRFYDFDCGKHVTEHFIDENTLKLWCPQCGQLAKRMISSPAIHLEGWSGNFPSSANKWEQRHARPSYSEEE